METINLKKLLLIGDSIRLGYDKAIKKTLEGKAEVYFPEENCRFTSYILRRALNWKEEMNCGDDVDLVHFNAGLWDDLVLLDGKHLTPINVYQENLQRICDTLRILFPCAKLIFATSTPVRESLFLGPIKRYNRDTEMFNAAARKVMEKNNCEINDLYAAVSGCDESFYSDMTHLYTECGTDLMAKKVVQTIENALHIKAKEIDFKAAFRKVKGIEGF